MPLEQTNHGPKPPELKSQEKAPAPSAAILNMKKGLEAGLETLSLFKKFGPDIEKMRTVVEEQSAKPHLNVLNYLITLEREFYALGRKGAVSPESFQIALGLVRGGREIETRKTREAKSEEVIELMSRPFPELLDLLKQKADQKERVDDPLFLAVLEKLKQFTDEYSAWLVNPESKGVLKIVAEEELEGVLPKVNELARIRQVRQVLLAHVGRETLGISSELGKRERGVGSLAGESAFLESGERELAARSAMSEKLFGKEEAENLENVARLHRFLNRNLQGVDSRPEYTGIGVSWLLLETVLRWDELPEEMRSKNQKSVISLANGVARHLNLSLYLDLGRLLKEKRGELRKWDIQTFKMKEFLTSYPDIWRMRDVSQENLSLLAQEFYRNLSAVRRGAESEEEVREFMLEGQNPALARALGFETTLRELAGYGPAIKAIRDAYGVGEKLEAEEIEVIEEMLKTQVRKRRIFMGGRGATTEQKYRRARQDLERFRKEKAAAEDRVREEPGDKEYAEMLKKIEVKIAKLEGWIKHLAGGRRTERDIMASEFTISRFSEIEEALSLLSRKIGPEEDAKKTMRELYKILFTP